MDAQVRTAAPLTCEDVTLVSIDCAFVSGLDGDPDFSVDVAADDQRFARRAADRHHGEGDAAGVRADVRDRAWMTIECVSCACHLSPPVERIEKCRRCCPPVGRNHHAGASGNNDAVGRCPRNVVKRRAAPFHPAHTCQNSAVSAHFFALFHREVPGKAGALG